MTVTTLYLGLLIATITQSTLLIAALLSSKQSNKTANYLLSGIIALFSYYTLIKILCGTELILQYPYFIQTYRPLPFLVWAAFYFYTKAMTDPSFRFQRKDSLHLLPFGLYTLFSLSFFVTDEATQLQIVLLSALLFFYLILSYRILRDHQQRIKDVFSNLEQVKLDWLKYLLAAFGIIWATAFINGLAGIVDYKAVFVLPPILLCLTIYAIGFYALRQPEIFKDAPIDPASGRVKLSVEPAPVSISHANQPPKYECSGLTSQELSAYGEKLIAYLEEEKPYTNNDLKLQDIADSLGLPAYQLSQIINTTLQRNFYDLVNSYRIEEAKRQLIAPTNQHFTILAIAYDVGFNSKSAFNTAFKKYTKMTPSQYKHSQLSAALA